MSLKRHPLNSEAEEDLAVEPSSALHIQGEVRA